MQQIGETRDAIIEDDNKLIEEIVNANQHIKNKYWIVVFAKASKAHVDGKPVMAKHIKPYTTKPSSQVGQIVAEVDNSKGVISWEINMPQVPFDYGGLGSEYIPGGEVVIETTTCSHAYLTK